MEEKQTNTTTCTNELRPEKINCRDCGKALTPVLLPEISGIPARWLKITICDPCVERREQEALRRNRQGELRRRFGNSMLTPRFMERTFENFVANDNNRKAYEAAVNFRIDGSGKGLLLYGPPGIGKTHLVAAIANKLLETCDVLYMSCPEFLEKLREGVDKKSNSHLLAGGMHARLLILNDIGAEKSSEWVQDRLFLLIDHRYENKLPVVFTTNCSMDQLEERLGDRIVSRIFEMCRCIKYEDKDFRMQKSLKVVNA